MFKMEEKKYRNQLKELVETAKGMHQRREYKNPEYGEICMAVVSLIERSDLGRKEAESGLELKAKHDNLFDEILDGSFDGASMQYMKMCSQYLGRFGQISMVPYPGGLGTRTALATFKPKARKQGGK